MNKIRELFREGKIESFEGEIPYKGFIKAHRVKSYWIITLSDGSELAVVGKEAESYLVNCLNKEEKVKYELRES